MLKNHNVNKMPIAHNWPRITDVSGPYFVDPTEKHQAAFTQLSFPITELHVEDGINEMPEIQVTCILSTQVANLSKIKPKNIKGRDVNYPFKEYKSTEDFLSDQIDKSVVVCFERPMPSGMTADLKKVFQLKTYLCGIIVGVELFPGHGYDIVKLVIRPPQFILQHQNNFRSFEEKTTEEILKQVFKVYEEKFTQKVFSVKYKIEEKTKLRQIIQIGESDWDFVCRLIAADKLSFFFYYTEKMCNFIITDNITESLKQVREENFQEAKPVTFTPTVHEPNLTFILIEGTQMPLLEYRVNIDPSVQQYKVLAYPDYRLNKPLESKDVKAKKSSYELEVSQTFSRESFHLISTSKLPDDVITGDNKSKLTENTGNRLLYQSASKSYSVEGLVKLFGFWPLWGECKINPSWRQNRLGNNYISNLKYQKESEFLAYKMTHTLRLPPQTYAPPSARVANQRENRFASCDVRLHFMPASDKNYVVPHAPFKQFSKGPYIAEVVAFEKKDTTKKDYDVTNAYRVKMPWHGEGESIKARWSTFWASKEYGSVFLPQPGDEVLIVFLEDDPNYPVMLNYFYNAKNNYPLKISEREEKTDFDTRGIMFEMKTSDTESKKAQILFQPIKAGDNVVPTLGLENVDGDIVFKSTNIEENAIKSYKLHVAGESNSTITVDDKSLSMNAFGDAGSLVFSKDEQSLSMSSDKVTVDGKSELNLQSAKSTLKASGEMTINADGSMKISAADIKANSLTLPGG